MKNDALYIVQVRKGKRWAMTIWTGHIPVTKRSRKEIDDETGRPVPYTGKPVTLRSAKLAMGRAKKSFPESEFRVREVATGATK